MTPRQFCIKLGIAATVLAANLGTAWADGPHVDSYHPPPERDASAEKMGVSASFIRDIDHISVLEISGNYDRDVGGQVNLEARRAVSRAFYEHHQDNFDFLVVFTGFEFNTGNAVAFHIGVQNQIQGLGLPIYNQTAEWGSDGRLKGWTDMAALSRYEPNPLNADFDRTLSILAHELMHQWCCRFDFERPGDPAPQDGLLGLDDVHWSYLFDSDASVMFGNDWLDLGDGTFKSVDVFTFYGPLDLYAAGFLPADQVPELLLIDNPEVDPDLPQQLGAVVSGAATTVRLDDIVRAEGPRIPAAADAQKEFRAGFIYLIQEGAPIFSNHLRQIEDIRQAFIQRFSIMTGGQGVMEIYPSDEPTGTTGEPEPVDGGTLRPTADVDLAVAWLRDQQAGDGSWQDRPGSRLRDTQVALATLLTLAPSFDPAAAAVWLGDESSDHVDAFARRGLAKDRLGLDA
ncbi:MAG: hypothetical protein AAFY88_18890, partial [Acidobacteriota bacterium]